MPTKKQRRLLKKEQKGKEPLTYHRQKKLKRFVLVAAGVLILGGVFSGGWFLGASSSSTTKVVSEVTPASSLPEVNTEIVTEETQDSFLPEIERISVEALKAKLDTGSNILIIDSQTEKNYELAHIAGAISIPFLTMAEPYSQLDGYDEIITYCNWAHEEDSARAAQKLMDAGYSNVKALAGGINAWKGASLPLEGTSLDN